MVVVTAIDGEEGTSRVLSEGLKLADRFDEPFHAVPAYEEADHQHPIGKSLSVGDSISRPTHDRPTRNRLFSAVRSGA